MAPTEDELKAVHILWDRDGEPGREPTPDEQDALLAQVRENVRRIESEAYRQVTGMMSRPSRSGLFSRYAPRTVGLIFLMIVAVPFVIWAVFLVMGR